MNNSIEPNPWLKWDEQPNDDWKIGKADWVEPFGPANPVPQPFTTSEWVLPGESTKRVTKLDDIIDMIRGTSLSLIIDENGVVLDLEGVELNVPITDYNVIADMVGAYKLLKEKCRIDPFV